MKYQILPTIFGILEELFLFILL